MVPKDELTLAILAGGGGFRLGGVDKATLRCEGRTLLERLMELRGLAADVRVVRAKDDAVKGKGAPGGVVTALSMVKTPWVLVVCCDMPHVLPAAVTALCDAASEDTDVCVFEVGTVVQPFPGLYRARLAELWRARLEKNPSMGGLLASAACVRLGLAEHDPRGWSVRSVNTPADARELGVEL